MVEYRLAEEDDMDDFEEGAPINVDDDIGEYGMDDEEEELTAVVGPAPAAPEPVMVMGVAEAIAEEAAPARKPAKKASAPKKAAAKKAAPKPAAKKAAPK